MTVIERIEGAHNVHVLYLAEDQYMNEEDIFFVASDTADVEQNRCRLYTKNDLACLSEPLVS